jgi:hypothetical protein
MMEIMTIHRRINLKKGHITNILKENVVQPLLMSTNALLTPKIPWDQKLVDCCLGNLCEEK